MTHDRLKQLLVEALKNNPYPEQSIRALNYTNNITAIEFTKIAIEYGKWLPKNHLSNNECFALFIDKVYNQQNPPNFDKVFSDMVQDIALQWASWVEDVEFLCGISNFPQYYGADKLLKPKKELFKFFMKERFIPTPEIEKKQKRLFTL